MDVSKKGLRAALFCLVLLFAMRRVELLQLGVHLPGPSRYCIVMAAIYVGWGFSVFRRFPQKRMRVFLMLLVAAFVLLTLLRTAKYAFVTWDGAFARHLWYAYYIPILFGSLWLFRAAQYIGKPNDYRVSRRWDWLYLPVALLVCGMMANDRLQLAFRFAPGFAEWESNYTRGPLYFAAVGWIALLAAVSVFLCVRATVSRRLLKTAWLPLAVLALCALNGLGYLFDTGFFATVLRIADLPDFICLCTIVIWESLVAARIVTSNNGYPDVFAASSLHAGLADLNDRVRQTSVNGIRPTPEQLRKAKNSELLLPDGDTLLKVRPVQGGWFYWTEDVAELRRLNEALDETALDLQEENAFLRETLQLDEERRRTLQKSDLYDDVTRMLLPKIEKLDRMLETPPADETAFLSLLRQASVTVAFMKRYSNLFLLAHADEEIDSLELRLCLEESAISLRLCGAVCQIAIAEGLWIRREAMLLLYELFEAFVEAALPSLTAVHVTLSDADGRTVFTLEEERPAAEPEAGVFAEMAAFFSGADLSRREDAIVLTLQIPPEMRGEVEPCD